MDCPCGKFGDCSCSRFYSVVQTHRQTRMNAILLRLSSAQVMMMLTVTMVAAVSVIKFLVVPTTFCIVLGHVGDWPLCAGSAV